MRWPLALFVIVGCNGGDDGGHELGPDANVDAASPASDLEGKWKLDLCGTSLHLVRDLVAVDSTFVWRTSFYEDNDGQCTQQPYAWLNVNESFSVGGDAPLAENARKIDIQTRGATLAPLTDDATATYNNNAWCGFTNWQRGVARDVTGAQCGDGDPYFSAGHMFYSIYMVANDRLYLGDATSGTGSSDGTRPTRLANVYAQKQP